MFSQLWQIIDKERKKDIEQRIYHELPKHNHLAIYGGFVNGTYRQQSGMGVFVNGHYITTAHIPNILFKQPSRTPFGTIYSKRIGLEKPSMSVHGEDFEWLVNDVYSDVFIAKQKGENSFPNFPAKPAKREVQYGDKVYLIGNPRLLGTNIRKGYVSDIDGLPRTQTGIDQMFGFDFAVEQGDSGCPVVNEDFELVGLARIDAFRKLGYINKIQLYANAIEKLNGKNLQETR
ncbi:trypsin-like peptidase domain-containing protein [Methanococcoides sp. SA1]|nr:trypsin-like peptidase domain-containing protein [Methanococcoides sp. SA1]